jgi:O-acetyl-ADP-ribose deacetylase (regulator of RNase III)
MQVVLAAIDDSLADAWHRFCGDLEFVKIHSGSILDVPCDAVVSPANSFGFMDGGVDAQYRSHFGSEIQERVQGMIRDRYQGELPVGRADLVETAHPQIPYLIVAPTMRVPMKLEDSVNPYLAARAIFLLLSHGSFADGPHEGAPIRLHIKTVAIPGLGTGVGQIGPNACAHQVRAAIDDVLLDQFKSPRTWAEASERHQSLYGGRVKGLQ